MPNSFEISGKSFLRDGRPHKVLSGALHYFRIVPEYWERRLVMLRELGCNTAETYMAWHYHEPRRGEYDFSGTLDVAEFIRTAGRLGVDVIVRPGPYICSECDLGGLPWWLLAESDMPLRCADPRYLAEVARYLGRVCDILRPLLATRGGPVVMVQIENEYGGRGIDREYLTFIRDFYISHGIDVPLFVSDYPNRFTLEQSGPEGALLTANFRTESERLSVLEEVQPDKPVMVGEYWNGRQMNWELPFAPVEVGPVAEHLGKILDRGQGVSLYMFHGGTNFGFKNGARYEGGVFRMMTSSYDVDAPLNEYGEPTPKYFAEQKEFFRVLGRELPAGATLTAAPRKAYGEIRLTSCLPLLGALGKLWTPVHSAAAKTMEQLGCGYGYVAYVKDLPVLRGPMKLVLPTVHDRADVFINGEYRATVLRDHETETPVALTTADSLGKLVIIVENSGRLNSAPLHLLAKERKGLPDGATLNGALALLGWDIYTLPFDTLPAPENYSDVLPGTRCPALYRGEFEVVGTRCDTFVKVEGFDRGAVFINGFNLGRHIAAGPQRTLYLPAPLLREGKNELVVYDSGSEEGEKRAFLTDTHELCVPIRG